MKQNIKIFVPGRIGIIGEISDLVQPYLKENINLVEGHAIAMPISKGIYSNAKIAEKLIYKYKYEIFETEITQEKLKKQIDEESWYSYICGTIMYIKQNYEVNRNRN